MLAFTTLPKAGFIRNTYVSSNKGNQVTLSAVFAESGEARCIVRDITSPRIIPTIVTDFEFQQYPISRSRPPLTVFATAEVPFSQAVTGLVPNFEYEAYCVQSGFRSTAIQFKTRSYVSTSVDIVKQPTVDIIGGEWMAISVVFAKTLPTRCVVLKDQVRAPTAAEIFGLSLEEQGTRYHKNFRCK